MGVPLICHLHRLPPKCALSHQQASPSRDQMALADPLWAGLPRHQKPLPVMEHIVILEKRQVSMETTGLYSPYHHWLQGSLFMALSGALLGGSQGGSS